MQSNIKRTPNKKNAGISENEWQQIFQSIIHPTTIIDTNYNILAINHAALDFFNIKEKDVIGKKCYQVYHNTKRPVYDCPVKQIKKTLLPRTAAVMSDSKSLLISFTPVVDKQNRLKKMLNIAYDITTMKNSEDILKQWSERYEMITTAAGQVAYDYHISSGKIIWGASMKKVLGYVPGQEINTFQEWKSLLHPDDSKKTLEYLSQAKSKCTHWDAEYRMKHKNGNYLWIRDRGFFLPDEKGKALRQLGVIEDITTAREIVEKLRKTQKLLEDTQAVAKIGGWEYDVKTGTMSWTKELFDIYGLDESYDPSDARKNIAYYIPGDQEKAKKALRTTIKESKSYELELELVRADGKRIWIRTRGHPVIENGEVVRVTGNMIDITEQKLAEEQNKILAGLTEVAPAWITVHDLKGNFLYANKRTLESHGYTEDEFFKLTLHDIETPDNAHRVESRIQKLLKQGEDVLEVTHRRKDGSIIPLQLYTKLIEWKGEKVILSVGLDITERKQAEEAIRESEQRFRDIAQAAAEFIWEIDKRGRYSYVTEIVQTILGRPLLDILNHTPYEFMPPAEAKRVYTLMAGLIKQKKPFHNLEHKSLRPDGSEIWMRISGVPLLNAKGELTGFRGAGAEITADKRAEAALRESEEKYRSLFENANESIMIIQDFKPVFLNPMTSVTTGYSADELMSKHFSEIVHPEDREVVLERHYKRIRGENVPPSFSHRIINKQGETIWINMNVVKINWNGRPATLHLSTDITAEKLAQEALRESEEKYRRLFENANEAIVIIQDGKPVFHNPMTNIMTGYSMEEVQANDFTRLVHPDDRILLTDRYQRRMKGENVIPNYSFRIQRKDNKTRWVNANVVMITWNNKPATLNFISDITDRKLLEEERQRVEKLESIGIMAGGIAHDFNNILTAIIGNISLAKIIVKPEGDSLAILNEAEKASMRAKGLTQQLLTFSKGGLPIKKNLSIEDLLRETAEFTLRGSNIKCKWDIADDLWHVKGDEGQLNQVINNLVLNAQQAMPSGGIIEIKAENLRLTAKGEVKEKISLPEGNYVKITITDHGIGIPSKSLDKIFDPFFTTKQKGSGLGLSTSYSIIRNHGGHIDVESAIGSGTTFFIYLPASKRTISKQEEHIPMLQPGNDRILIMDDEPAVIEVLIRMMKQIGYKDITFTREGKEAVRLYQKALETGNPFDLVILDLTIPGGMGGRETVKRLKKINPDIKAIVSSGYSTESVIADYSKYGFSGVVTKPYNLEQLRQVLLEILKR